jgi:hypothetical protein
MLLPDYLAIATGHNYRIIPTVANRLISRKYQFITTTATRIIAQPVHRHALIAPQQLIVDEFTVTCDSDLPEPERVH